MEAVVCLLCGSSAVSLGTTRPRPWQPTTPVSFSPFLQRHGHLASSSSFSSFRHLSQLHYRNLSSPHSLSTSTSGDTSQVRRKKPNKKKTKKPAKVEEEDGVCIPSVEEASIRVETVYQNGDPLGKKELGKCVVRWISLGMGSMAADFASAELKGEFDELRLRLGMEPTPNGNGNSGGNRTGVASVSMEDLTFVIHAQRYLNAVPMPKGLEAICFKACTHYPTLFDHFQRELRTVLLDLQEKSVITDWKSTQSWKLLKKFAKSAQHRAIVRRAVQVPKPTHSVLGIEMDRVKAMQTKIEDFVKHMSELLGIERDAELEFTQEELSAVPKPEEKTDSTKPIEYLVSHGQSQQEQCDTICNLNAISSSTGLGGLHLVLFRAEDKHKLPPTNLSPGDMVCVRTCNRNDGCATSMSSLQGFVYNFGEDGCSITVALESRRGDPTFSKFFGKTVRIDRIQGLADAVTYERNCEALMLLQKKGLHKRNPSINVVATLFGEKEDIALLEQNNIIEWGESKLPEFDDNPRFDKSQLKSLSLGLNKKRPLLIIQGPPGTGKTGLLKQLIVLAVQQGERVLVTAPTNAAVDNMVERLSDTDLNIVRLGNPARIAPAVSSKSLGEIVNNKLYEFKKEFERKKSNLRKDLRLCLKDDTLASGIRQLLKQLGRNFKRKEKETIKNVLSEAHVVLSSNTGATDPLIRELSSFDLVIIDEAGQAIEPSSWIPILQGKRCILAGDQCQLAPVILSREAMEGGLGVSLLERASFLHQGMLTTRLMVQYRMHDAIASWASNEMYDGLLKSHPSVSSHLLRDSPFVKVTWATQCPLLLLDTRMPYGSLSVGCEEHLDPAGTGSFYNDGEADIVVQHVFNLLYSGVSPTAIAVQSPYIAQVQLLRDRFAEYPEASRVEVSTVDSFQGREADAVIISMVRSNTLGAVGFVGNSRRMNVAITRARKHVALVCDSSTICHNTFLARLLRHIRRYGRVQHAEPGDDGPFGSGFGFGLGSPGSSPPLLPSFPNSD
ncbi:P-loop containing nucleoside triphosphate hydrolases superfamily protein [Rhynchospora pubera]|uniref:P-loop containing nucleoside triphosphate hydrolases superfamily protein n=1 Tax=Rhynchospora pubera TaxID=906938 RepID=A0AAV8DJE7_9POAL|nr:P-loop containing nucleoside triphosphate hydrolases superfamily protein [Rhynchospora pubera]